MLRAAMYSPESNQRMGRIVVGLGPEVAVVIAAAMKQMEETDLHQPDPADRFEYKATPDASTPVEPRSGAASPPVSTNDHLSFGASVDRDPELEQEEKLIQALKVINDLENSNAKAATEAEHEETLLQGLRHYPKAVAWSVFVTMAVVMDGYDEALIKQLFAEKAFKRR